MLNKTIKKKKKRKKTGASLITSVGIKATFDLLDMLTAPGVLQFQCIHLCHTNRLIIRLPSLMICVNCLRQKGQRNADFLTMFG